MFSMEEKTRFGRRNDQGSKLTLSYLGLLRMKAFISARNVLKGQERGSGLGLI